MLADFTALILAYKYWAIFPCALFDAPLVSIIVGFFAATGDLALLPAFGVVAFGDFIGDTGLYVFGRWCRPWFERIGLRLTLSPGRVRKVLEYFSRHDRHAIVISKLIRGVGFTGLIVAGSIKVPYRRFITTCIAVTVSLSAVLAAVGMLSGQAYQSLAGWFGNLDLVVAALFLIALPILYRVLLAKIGDRDEKDKAMAGGDQ